MGSDFEERLSKRVSQVEDIVYKFLPKEEGYAKTVIEAMNYSIKAGGKRLRPLMMHESFLLFSKDADDKVVWPFMAAMEMIHTYSLVHDDLPAMDNDDYRRGKLSAHKKYGEANGILTGDALLTEAANSLIKSAVGKDANYLLACQEIMRGAEQMVNGQVKDLAGCKDKDEYLKMYAQKTGALILASVRAGALLAGASADELESVSAYAQRLGLAFQLADDLLDDDGEPSIINAIGREETVRLLDVETCAAIECAAGLKNADELISFAKALSVRKN